MSAQADNRATVERFWKALDDGPPRGATLEAWKDTFADDSVWEMPFAPEPLSTSVPGRHLIGHFIDWFFESVPDLHVDSLTVHDTTDPELFILDEPTAALDPEGRRDVARLNRGFPCRRHPLADHPGSHRVARAEGQPGAAPHRRPCAAGVPGGRRLAGA